MNCKKNLSESSVMGTSLFTSVASLKRGREDGAAALVNDGTEAEEFR